MDEKGFIHIYLKKGLLISPNRWKLQIYILFLFKPRRLNTIQLSKVILMSKNTDLLDSPEMLFRRRSSGELLKIPGQNFLDCFGCSPNNTRGLQLPIWYFNEECISFYKVPPEYCGFRGLTHGGIIATLLDEIAAWTIITNLLQMGITTRISIRYVQPIPTDTEILIKGKIINQEIDRINVRSIISSPEGKLLAEAESEWILANSSTISRMTGWNEHKVKQLIDEMIFPVKERISPYKKPLKIP